MANGTVARRAGSIPTRRATAAYASSCAATPAAGCRLRLVRRPRRCSSASNAGDWGKTIVQPDEVGGRETQSPCVIVADADAHYARAVAAGASIVIDIADQPYGGRGYACKDPEGHLWWFGSYDPWAEQPEA